MLFSIWSDRFSSVKQVKIRGQPTHQAAASLRYVYHYVTLTTTTTQEGRTCPYMRL